ncbi:MAG: hypothetical protein Q9O62_15480 [Ardenticatenia bacterium]|nr:hypothetical protein [Ardenticatenia bacterium]
MEQLRQPLVRAYRAAAEFIGVSPEATVEQACHTALKLLHHLCHVPGRWQAVAPALVALLTRPVVGSALYLWALFRALGDLEAPTPPPPDAAQLAHERMIQWQLARIVSDVLTSSASLNEAEAHRAVQLAGLLLVHADSVNAEPNRGGKEEHWRPKQVAGAVLARWLNDPEAGAWLHRHEHGGVEWVHGEAFDQAAVAVAAALAALRPRAVHHAARVAAELVRAGKQAGYRVDRLREQMDSTTSRGADTWDEAQEPDRR